MIKGDSNVGHIGIRETLGIASDSNNVINILDYGHVGYWLVIFFSR